MMQSEKVAEDLRDAHEVIAGYTITNDLSVRDWQLRTPTMTLGKSFDTHGPLGPWVVTADELGDPHTGLDHDRLVTVSVVQDHPQLAPVTRIHEPGCVHDRDPVPRREAGTRNDEPRVTIRNRHRNSRPDERALSGAELVMIAGDQIEARIAGVRPGR